MTEIIMDNDVSAPLVFGTSNSIVDDILERMSKSFVHFDPDTGDILGTYVATNAKSAAERAFTAVLKEIKQCEGDITQSQEIFLQEQPTGVHGFLIQRVKRDKPLRLNIGTDKTFVFNYENLIQRIVIN